jgi:hypothetical protein
MPMITIERLSLEMPGKSEEDGRTLARLVGAELADLPLPPDSSLNLSTVKVNVPGAATSSSGALSRLIAADILRQLQQST